MKEIQQLVGDYLEDRPVMKANNSFRNVVLLLMGEVLELVEAHPSGDKKDIASEVADVFAFALTLANILNVDAEAELRTKIARNCLKYPANLFQGQMNYNEAVKESRKQWIDSGGDKEFYS